MRYSLAALALAAVASAVPAAPATAAASDCSGSYSGSFEIQVVNVTSSKRDIIKRDPLVLTLNGGVLKDAQGRIGYIAANRQFQFDNPVQAGTIYDAGWAVCSNNTLVLGPDATFQQCLSGTFYNLYDEATAAQCSPVYINVVKTGGVVASQIGDGQVTASAVASQITDGQIQASSAAPGPVTQISDGQVQGPTGVVTQISDGQVQQPTGVVSQISDGQIQQPTGVVSQISDGQPQAPKTTVAPVSTSRPAVVSQISDGQPQVPTNGTTPVRPSATVQPYTGAAAGYVRSELFGLAAGVLAVAML